MQNFLRKFRSLGDTVFSQWVDTNKEKDTSSAEILNQLRSLTVRLLLDLLQQEDGIQPDLQDARSVDLLRTLLNYSKYDVSLLSLDFSDPLSEEITRDFMLKEIADYFIARLGIMPLIEEKLTVSEGERSRNIVRVEGSQNVVIKNVVAGENPTIISIDRFELNVNNVSIKEVANQLTPILEDQASLANYLDIFIEDHKFPTWETISDTRKISIRQIFVKLNVSSKSSNISDGAVEANEGLQVLTVPQVLRDSNRRLLILGDPGAGKTTLLKYMGLIYAYASRFVEQSNLVQTELGVDDDGLLPILVSVGHFAGQLRGKRGIDPEYLLQYIKVAVDERTRMLSVFPVLYEYLTQGKCILLLDGLDEVSNPDLRDKVIRIVDSFVRDSKYCNNRFVVSSRILGYRDAVKLQEDFLESEILPFDFEDIRQFVRNYCEAAVVARGLKEHSPETERYELENYLRDNLPAAYITAISLVSRIFGNSALLNIATNPLLLTIICIVFHPRIESGVRSKLPSRRIDLLKECTTILIEKWPRTRGESLDKYRDFSSDVERDEWQEYKQILLGKIAFRMQETEGYSLTSKEVRRLIKHQLQSEYFHEHRDRAKSLFFSETEAILHSKQSGSFSFVHPNIREYLAATWISQQKNKSEQLIAAHLGDNSWHEVIVYALALTAVDRPKFAERIFQDMITVSSQQLEIVSKALIEIGSNSVPLLSVTENTRKNLTDTINNPKTRVWRRIQLADLLGQLGDQRVTPDAPPQTVFVQGDSVQLQSLGTNVTQYIDSFHVAKYLVTNEQMYSFVKTNRNLIPQHWKREGYPSNRPTHPVVDISLDICLEYCHWLSQLYGHPYRLLTEYEWEMIAGWDPITKTARLYPWGKEWSPEKCNCQGAGVRRQTTPVGLFPEGKSAYDIYDLSGNVWEWTGTTKTDLRIDLLMLNARELKRELENIEIVIKGGSFMGFLPDQFSASYRIFQRTNTNFLTGRNIGFRVAYSAEKSSK